MYTDLINQWTEYSSVTLNSMKKLSEITTKNIEKLSGQQMEMFKWYMDTTPKQMKLVSEAKDYQELVASTAGLVGQYNEEATKLFTKTQDLVKESSEELVKWYEENLTAIKDLGLKKAA